MQQTDFNVGSLVYGHAGISGTDLTWSQVHDPVSANNYLSRPTGGGYIMCSNGASATPNTWYNNHRMFVSYNLSSLTSYQTISSAYIYFYLGSVEVDTADGKAYLGIYSSSHSPTGDLVASDFSGCGNTLLSAEMTGYGLSPLYNQYVSLQFNATGVSALENAKGTYISLSFRLRGDAVNSFPWVANDDSNYYIYYPIIHEIYIRVNWTYDDDAGFRYRKSGTTYGVCTTSTDPGGNRKLIRKSGVTYYMPLVAVDHADASSFRVRYNGATYAGLLIT